MKCKVFLLLIALGSSTLFAQSTSVGVGVGIQNDIYKGADSKVVPLPIINYRNNYLYINGAEIGTFLYQNSMLSLSATVKGRFDGYDDAKGYMSGMKDRKFSVEGGLRADLKTDFGNLKTGAYYDLLGRYDGYSAELEYSYPFNYERWGFAPFVGVEYLSGDLVEYYYGVKHSEARAGRAYYAGGNTVNLNTGINAYYILNDSFTLFGRFGATFFGDDIKKSHIVKEDYRVRGFVGISYKF
ncbi:MAG: MipA/OmpV family protein [Campylobacteraceae bacterium]